MKLVSSLKGRGYRLAERYKMLIRSVQHVVIPASEARLPAGRSGILPETKKDSP